MDIDYRVQLEISIIWTIPGYISCLLMITKSCATNHNMQPNILLTAILGLQTFASAIKDGVVTDARPGPDADGPRGTDLAAVINHCAAADRHAAESVGCVPYSLTWDGADRLQQAEFRPFAVRGHQPVPVRAEVASALKNRPSPQR